MRGEDKSSDAVSVASMGTPPRARGRLSPPRDTPTGLGNTPACAGKTRRRTPHSAPWWEHPRVRGEDNDLRANSHAGVGTPPRARGRLAHCLAHCLNDGNTPACAGKTGGEEQAWADRGEHPRVRGEDGPSMFTMKGFQGTPPRARGRPSVRPPSVKTYGNTPACAGKTVVVALEGVQTREHPRVRGEDRR